MGHSRVGGEAGDVLAERLAPHESAGARQPIRPIYQADAAILAGPSIVRRRGDYNLIGGSLVRRWGLCGLTINVAVLLAVIIVVRLRRRTQARSRNDEKLTVLIVLARSPGARSRAWSRLNCW
ncbi:hypothetical protein STPH1_7140 [Streptomyces sp. OM5714]|nr:hypothetical protein STPH1_7140 [Streptomyces sp. OM5714]